MGLGKKSIYGIFFQLMGKGDAEKASSLVALKGGIIIEELRGEYGEGEVRQELLPLRPGRP